MSPIIPSTENRLPRSLNKYAGRKTSASQIDQIIAMYEAGGAGMIYHGMSEDDVQRIMREPLR